MNAVLNINSMTTLLMPLDEAVKVAEILKNSTHLDRKYTDDRYELKGKPVFIEIELATETEVSQWLS